MASDSSSPSASTVILDPKRRKHHYTHDAFSINFLIIKNRAISDSNSEETSVSLAEALA